MVVCLLLFLSLCQGLDGKRVASSLFTDGSGIHVQALAIAINVN